MDRQFGFDFEARGKRWKTLDEAAGERTVAGENVAESVAEKRTIESVEQPVAERMAGAMHIFFYIGAHTDRHIDSVVDDHRDELRRRGGVIRAVAVGHYIHVGGNFRERAAHHIA